MKAIACLSTTQHILTIYNQQPNNGGNRRHHAVLSPAIASLMARFMRPRSKNHPLNTNTPVYYTNSTFIVSTIISQQLVQIAFTGFLFGRYKGLPSMNNTFTCASFFLIILLSFSSHTFSWGCGSLREPRNIFSFCAFTCLSNNSLISLWISAKLGSALPHVCSICHTVFSLKNTLEYFLKDYYTAG